MSSNFSYEIMFTATNYTSNTISTLTTQLSDINMKLYQTSEAADKSAQSFRGLNTSISTGELHNLPSVLNNVDNSMNRTLRSTQMMIFGLQMSTFYISMLVSNMNREENQLESVTNARRHYTEVVRESGRGSLEARDALEALNKAERNYQTASMMSNIMTLSMGLQFVSLGASVMQFLPRLHSLTAGLKALSTAQVLAQITSPIGIATLAIGAGVGAGVYYGVSQMMSQPSTNVNVTVDTNAAIIEDYMRRRGASNIKSVGAT